MTFCKYEFPSEKWSELKPTINLEGLYSDCVLVEIGHICLEEGTEGDCISRSPVYAVDIMWYKEIPAEFNQYEVFPEPTGLHSFAGCESLYKNRFCEFNPENSNCINTNSSDSL